MTFLGCVACGRATFEPAAGGTYCLGCSRLESLCECADPFGHLIVGGPWPERIGLRCRIQERPAGYDRYPWSAKPHPSNRDIIVEVEGDQLREPVIVYVDDVPVAAWTCVLYPEHLEAVGDDG